VGLYEKAPSGWARRVKKICRWHIFSQSGKQAVLATRAEGCREATEGERVTIKSVQSESHAGSFRHASRATFLPEEGFCARRSSADHGFGLLPDLARWTATRYACPGRERQENRKTALTKDILTTQPT